MTIKTKTMNDINGITGTLYHPQAALLIYKAAGIQGDSYVEYFDIDRNGRPINAHPLTVREAQQMAKALDTSAERNAIFLRPKQIISPGILYIDPSPNGYAMWFTKASVRQLFFADSLGIPNGKAHIPSLLWIGTKHKLYVYALNSNRKPDEGTKLYHAPFFNIYADGSVCMGTVNVNIKKSASLEEFTAAWEQYFFNSYFSHLMQNHNPVDGNCVSLWKGLVNTGAPFPTEKLRKTGRTIKSILQ